MFTQHLECSFDPETLKCIRQAFDAACQKLSLTDKVDPFTRIVAERVILLARPGEKNPAALCERVVRSIRIGCGRYPGLAAIALIFC